MFLDQTSLEQKVTPMSIFEALAQIGSLLGLLKLCFIFTLANQWSFEKNVLAKRYEN